MTGASECSIEGSLLKVTAQGLGVKTCLSFPGSHVPSWQEPGFVLTSSPSGHSRNIMPCRGLVDTPVPTSLGPLGM